MGSIPCTITSGAPGCRRARRLRIQSYGYTPGGNVKSPWIASVLRDGELDDAVIRCLRSLLRLGSQQEYQDGSRDLSHHHSVAPVRIATAL